VELREIASLTHRDGERPGWYLNDCLIPDSQGLAATPILDDLTTQGWKLSVVDSTACHLERPVPGAALRRL
jgi:hypothetical protein